MARQKIEKIDTSNLYLRVVAATSRDYYHIDCTVVAYDNAKQALLERYDSGVPRELEIFKGFEITAQGTNAERDDGLYGFCVRYKDIYEITLEKAETMVRILRMAKYGLDAYEREYSWPSSFGTYVTVIAKALGLQWFLFDRAPTEYNDSRFSLDDRRYGLIKIDRMVETWKAAGKAKEETTVDAE